MLEFIQLINTLLEFVFNLSRIVTIIVTIVRKVIDKFNFTPSASSDKSSLDISF